MAGRHGIISVEVDRGSYSPTARARCACGVRRQAGAFSDYPGEAGAILLVTQRFDCGNGPLGAFRAERPFPADPISVKTAAARLERQGAELRAKADRLLAQAQEYEEAARRLAAQAA